MCGSRALLHKHHIIPRYMGGSNAPENLVEVTVTQHAMFHFCNFQLWGNEEDKIAWRGLAGIIDREQIAYEMILLGVQAARTPEVIERKKEKFKEIGHQQGEKNSQYGKMWITDGTAEGSYRIYKGEPIPEGYRAGRVCKTNGIIVTIIKPSGVIEETDNLIVYCKHNNLNEKCCRRVMRGERKTYKNHRFLKGPISSQDLKLLKSLESHKKEASANKLNKKIQYYTELYEIYKREPNFRAFCSVSGYNKTRQNLYAQFKKYVESYEPQSKNQHTP